MIHLKTKHYDETDIPHYFMCNDTEGNGWLTGMIFEGEQEVMKQIRGYMETDGYLDERDEVKEPITLAEYMGYNPWAEWLIYDEVMNEFCVFDYTADRYNELLKETITK